MNWRYLTVFGLLLAAACTGVGRMPQGAVSRIQSPSAENLVGRLQSQNAALSPYKAIGQLRVQEGDNTWAIRSAWLGAPDGRLRVEALGLTGQPFAKMICTRRECFFVYRDGGCYRRKGTGNRSLEPLVGIDVEVADLAILLGGGVPIADHHSASLYSTDTGKKLMVLKNRFGGVVEEIHFSADLARVHQVARYGWSGLIYRARINGRRTAGSGKPPEALTFANSDGDTLHISADRSWSGVTLPKRIFSPDLPEGAPCDE